MCVHTCVQGERGARERDWGEGGREGQEKGLVSVTEVIFIVLLLCICMF